MIFKDTDIQGGVKGGRLGLASVSESMSGINSSTSFKDKFTDTQKMILNKYKLPIF
jgi:hypothetical protein